MTDDLTDDEAHEAFGAMIHRGKVDAASKPDDIYKVLHSTRMALARMQGTLDGIRSALVNGYASRESIIRVIDNALEARNDA
jgi:hypothetical protein